MDIKVGTILKSTELLANSYFKASLILITEYNERGAMGFVINKLFPRSLNHLVEFNWSPAFPLYEGGPVDQEHLFFIHRRLDLVEEGVSLGNGIYTGGNFKQAVSAINDHRMTASNCKIFVGYCGWDTGELEAEIAEGSWELVEEEINVFFL